MSSIKLESNASGTGIFTIASPNGNTNRTLTIPDATTTIVGTDATQTLTNKTLGSGLVAGASLITSDTSKTATSTSVDFTGIPSWVKRITVMFNGVSTNGTSQRQVQLGTSGGVETTGYTSSGFGWTGGTNGTSSTTGLLFDGQAPVAALLYNAVMTINNFSSNTWVSSGLIAATTGTVSQFMATGAKTLSGTLDRIRITTVNGTDAFDAGSINILYE